jgi:hypothetical protein
MQNKPATEDPKANNPTLISHPSTQRMLGYAGVRGIKPSRLTAFFSTIIGKLNVANPTYTEYSGKIFEP